MPSPQNARLDWSLKQKAKLYILLCLKGIPRTEGKEEGPGIRQNHWYSGRAETPQTAPVCCCRTGRGFHTQTQLPWLHLTRFVWKAQESSPKGTTACPWAQGVTQQEASQNPLPITLTETRWVTESSHFYSGFFRTFCRNLRCLLSPVAQGVQGALSPLCPTTGNPAPYTHTHTHTFPVSHFP